MNDDRDILTVEFEPEALKWFIELFNRNNVMDQGGRVTLSMDEIGDGKVRLYTQWEMVDELLS